MPIDFPELTDLEKKRNETFDKALQEVEIKKEGLFNNLDLWSFALGGLCGLIFSVLYFFLIALLGVV